MLEGGIEMGRPTWEVKLIKKMWPTRYLSAKAANVGLVGTLMEKALFKGDQMTQIPINKNIEGADQSVALPFSILEEFVREASVRVIMHTCICRDNNRCTRYPIELGCVFLGEAARGIDPSLGKQAGIEETLGHIKDALQAGLVPFTGRNKLDTVWLGVGPGERLLTICFCCPCCCLYSVYPYLPSRLQKTVVRLEGLEVQVGDRCGGCGLCETVCLSRAIHVSAGRAVIDEERCNGCGRCATECPEQAITLRLTRRDAVEACKQRIRSIVDVK
jgi:ferredoxin